MRKSIIAIIVAAVSVSSVAVKADTVTDALYSSIANNSISYNSFKSEWVNLSANQQADFRATERAHGTQYAIDLGNALNVSAPHNNPTGNPVNYTANNQPGAHLDGQHSAPAHQTASATPTIDRSSHLDSNATDSQRQQAQLTAAINHANSVTNGVDGKKGATGAQGVAGKKGAQGVAGRDGVDGKDGVNGKDADMTQVNNNSANIAANRGEIISHSRAISRNSAAIERNSKRIDKNASDIAENRKAIKRVGAMAQAASNLHYNRNENGYAVSVGEYAGATAIAGGVQFNTSETTAITVQASYDGDQVGASVGFHGNW